MIHQLLKLSNGWLDRFRRRYNIRFRIISGEAEAVDDNTIEDWKWRLPVILEHYNPVDVYNCDEAFFKMLSNQSFVIDKGHCKGQRNAIHSYFVPIGQLLIN